MTREPRPRNPRSGRGEAVCGSLPPPEFPLEPWLPLVEVPPVDPVEDPVDPLIEPEAEPLGSEDVPEDEPVEEGVPLD